MPKLEAEDEKERKAFQSRLMTRIHDSCVITTGSTELRNMMKENGLSFSLAGSWFGIVVHDTARVGRWIIIKQSNNAKRGT